MELIVDVDQNQMTVTGFLSKIKKFNDYLVEKEKEARANEDKGDADYK
jgi:hypothetical protein